MVPPVSVHCTNFGDHMHDIRRLIDFLANEEDWLRFLGLGKTADVLATVIHRYEQQLRAETVAAKPAQPAKPEAKRQLKAA